jgi:hypothetical protein
LTGLEQDEFRIQNETLIESSSVLFVVTDSIRLLSTPLEKLFLSQFGTKPNLVVLVNQIPGTLSQDKIKARIRRQLEAYQDSTSKDSTPIFYLDWIESSEPAVVEPIKGWIQPFVSQENKAKDLQKEALKFSTQKALDKYSDTITESVNALQSCEKCLEYLLSYARQQNSQLLQDFKASDFPILQENLALMVQGLREYFNKTGYLKLVYKSDAIAQDVLHTLQAHSLKPCDFQMVYALGKLKQAQKQTFQTLVDDLSDLSSLYPNLDPLLKQYITSFEDLIAQQNQNRDKEAYDPYWVRSLGADFGEKQRMEPEELQREADRLIRNGLGSFVRFLFIFFL